MHDTVLYESRGGRKWREQILGEEEKAKEEEEEEEDEEEEEEGENGPHLGNLTKPHKCDGKTQLLF